MMVPTRSEKPDGSEKILLFANGDVEVYHPDAGSKVFEAADEFQLYDRQAVMVNKRIFLSHAGMTDRMAILDVKSNEWQGLTSELPAGITSHTSIVAKNRVYLCGGFEEGGKILPRCYSYEPKALTKQGLEGTWTAHPPLVIPRSDAAAANYNENIFIFGGQDVDANAISSVEMLDTSTNEWKKCAPVPYPVYDAAATRIGQHIYLSGGSDDETDGLANCARFDPAKNEWTEIDNLNTGRTEHKMVVVKGQLIVIGGLDSEDNPLDTCEMYDEENDRWHVCAQKLSKGRGKFSAVSFTMTNSSTGNDDCSLM